MKKRILTGLIVLVIAVQAIQPTKNTGSVSGPKDITKMLPVPTEVQVILKRSCYDCHSNQTTYLWYDHITPINWWVADHVEDGKRELNFTEFGNYPARKQFKKLEEISESVQEGEMPLKSYLIMHGSARLTDAQKSLLLNWTNNTMNRTRPRP